MRSFWLHTMWRRLERRSCLSRDGSVYGCGSTQHGQLPYLKFSSPVGGIADDNDSGDEHRQPRNEITQATRLKLPFLQVVPVRPLAMHVSIRRPVVRPRIALQTPVAGTGRKGTGRERDRSWRQQQRLPDASPRRIP